MSCILDVIVEDFEFLDCRRRIANKVSRLISLSEEQYQHIQEEMKYSNRNHLSEDVFGGHELCLQAGISDVFGSTLELKTANTIDLGEVEWSFSKH